MREVIEYNIVSDFQHKFVETVNQAIKMGWQPFGGIVIAKPDVDKPGIVVYSQVMVKYDSPQPTAAPLKYAE